MKHIDSICSKLARSIGVLKKLSEFLPNFILRKLYMSIIYPHIIYCVEVWGNSSKTKLGRLRYLQNICLQLIGKEASFVPSLIKTYNILPFDNVYKYFVLIRFFKYHKLGYDHYFNNMNSTNMITHDHDTMSNFAGNLNYPIIRSSKKISSFFYNSISLWNKVPLLYKNVPSMRKFKMYLTNEFL